MGNNKKGIMSLTDVVGETVDTCAKEILEFTPQLYLKPTGETENIIPSIQD